ncbi:MAG: uroporphyrinogen decarboxylase family protein [Thermoproteales archaeon]|nr:uroporphyrinogen decarboxylase family protein [Thermoproteales archaeon]
MRNISGKELIMKSLEGENEWRVPIAPLIGIHSSKVFGVDSLIVFRDSDLMADLQFRISEYYGLDILLPWMDLTYEPEAFGVEIKWGNIPQIKTHLKIKNESDIDKLPEDISTKDRYPFYIETLRKMKEKDKENRYFICGYISGPLTIASSIMGGLEFSRAILLKRNLIRKLLMKITNANILAIKKLVKTGIDAIIILEPVAVFVSKKVFDETSFNFLNEMSKVIHGYNKYTILHICGRATHLLESIDRLDIDAYSFDDNVPLDLVHKSIKNASLMGNISTSVISTFKSNQIEEIVKELLRNSDRKRFILSTGCDIPHDTPEENIRALVKACIS